MSQKIRSKKCFKTHLDEGIMGSGEDKWMDCERKYELLRLKGDILHRFVCMENELDLLVRPDVEEVPVRRRRKAEFLRAPTEEEVLADYNSIKGIATTIKIMNGTLKVGEKRFKKNENVNIDMYGEIFNGTIKQITSDSLKLRLKNNKKVQIQLESIQNSGVKILVLL